MHNIHPHLRRKESQHQRARQITLRNIPIQRINVHDKNHSTLQKQSPIVLSTTPRNLRLYSLLQISVKVVRITVETLVILHFPNQILLLQPPLNHVRRMVRLPHKRAFPTRTV